MRKEALATMIVMIMIGTMGYALIKYNGDDNGISNTGNDTNNEIEEDWTVFYIDTVNNLPTCDSTTLGRLYYVVSNSVFEACTNSGWITVDLTGAAGTNGTDGQYGMDGVNGTDGQDGIDGVNGTDGQDVNSSYLAELLERIATLEGDLLNATTCQLGPYANCFGANLSGMDLSGMDLTGIDLRGALISAADLSNATLTYADLSGAVILHSDMNYSNFQHATMHGITVYNTYAQSSYFQGADLNNADLGNSNMINSYWNHADLSGTNLYAANMTGGYFSHTDISQASMYGTNMSNSNIFWADLGEAWTGYAWFYNVNWMHTICPDGTNSADTLGVEYCQT